MGIKVTETSTNTSLGSTSAITTVEWNDIEQKYVKPSTLINGSTSGPSAKLSMIFNTFQERDGEMIYSFSYQLDANRIKWGNIGLNIKLSDNVDLTANKDIETGGGSLAINATFVFNAKSMVLISQSSRKGDIANSEFGGATNPYVPFSIFAEQNIKVQAITYINWTNPNCYGLNKYCETGDIFEEK